MKKLLKKCTNFKSFISTDFGRGRAQFTIDLGCLPLRVKSRYDASQHSLVARSVEENSNSYGGNIPVYNTVTTLPPSHLSLMLLALGLSQYPTTSTTHQPISQQPTAPPLQPLPMTIWSVYLPIDMPPSWPLLRPLLPKTITMHSSSILLLNLPPRRPSVGTPFDILLGIDAQYRNYPAFPDSNRSPP